MRKSRFQLGLCLIVAAAVVLMPVCGWAEEAEDIASDSTSASSSDHQASDGGSIKERVKPLQSVRRGARFILRPVRAVAGTGIEVVGHGVEFLGRSVESVGDGIKEMAPVVLAGSSDSPDLHYRPPESESDTTDLGKPGPPPTDTTIKIPEPLDRITITPVEGGAIVKIDVIKGPENTKAQEERARRQEATEQE